MVEGLSVHRREDVRDKTGRRSISLELLAGQGMVEVTRQRAEAGKFFYLDAASEWEGFEFIYLLAGLLILKDKDKEILLEPGDYLYHCGLPERAYFRVEEDMELLMVASPPSFHLVRKEIQDMMALARSVEEKDHATEGHCQRIEQMSLRTGESLGLSGDQLITLTSAAYLHDIGKVKVSDYILNKPSSLTDKEWEEMRKHPEYGAWMLEGKDFLTEVSKVIIAHQEHYDGTGYPNRLKADQIPIEARIVAVVDAYDAMTSDRPYRTALSEAEARDELKQNAGTQFDPRVVEVFLAMLKEKDVS